MSAKKKKTSWLEGPWPYVLFGTAFGYFLSKARATDYDTIAGMFQLRWITSNVSTRIDSKGWTWQFPAADPQLYGVLVVAVGLIALGLFLFRLKGVRSREGDRLVFEQTSFEWNQLAGGLLFGAGWALAGACPATALAQIGEGKLSALFTVLGILVGMWVYMRFMDETCSDCGL